MTTTPDSQPTSAVTALEVLKELEWSGFGQTAGGFTSICPMCGGFNPTIWTRGKPHFDSEVGHAPTCRLAQALATDTTAERVVLQERVKALEGHVTDLANELESEIEARYPKSVRVYPSEQRRYDRDISTVLEARAALHADKPAVAPTEGAS